jgi:hypothetical protein
VAGYHLVDTLETAALEAIHTLYNQHPWKFPGILSAFFLQ